jgi:acetoin utilization deacetylase AcuC-like enzyme
MKVFYSDDYCRASHHFDTTKKSGWIADSLERRPITGVEVVAPAPATREAIEEVHSAEYVRGVETGSGTSTSGIEWCPNVFPAVLASTGGLVAAVRAAINEGVAGSLSSGMHHARRDHGLGFCTFNGLVVAANEAARLGRQKILILDLDAHGGGGTASLISDKVRISHLDLVVDPFDMHDDSIDLSKRSPIDYLTVLDSVLEEVDADFVLYNAGMDVFETDCGPRGFDANIVAAREATVFAWAADRDVPIAFAMAGGYTSPERPRELLVAHHRCTIRAAASIVRKGIPSHAGDLL